MKKVLSLLIIALILSLSGCSITKGIGEKDTTFYTGNSDSWLATYSITKAKSLCYDSLYIQYLFDDNEIMNEKDIGPIEYKLAGNSMEAESAYPLKLKDSANYHVGSITNPEVIKVTIDNDMELTIKWQGKEETLKLKRQN